MGYACHFGYLKVCKWLYYFGGAAADINKPNKKGRTPMWYACEADRLPVCKWLFDMGATADIRTADNKGCTPLFIACNHLNLSVFKWLIEVGAAADMTYMNQHGLTPMAIACLNHGSEICKLLVIMGALNRPARLEDDEDDDVNTTAVGHIDQALVKRDLEPGFHSALPDLFDWAQQSIAHHDTFLHIVLRASVILPASQQHAAPGDRCRLPWLFRTDHLIMRRVGSFLGVETGRRLRNVREFAEVLESLFIRSAHAAFYIEVQERNARTTEEQLEESARLRPDPLLHIPIFKDARYDVEGLRNHREGLRKRSEERLRAKT